MEGYIGAAIAALVFVWLCIPYEGWLAPRIERLHDSADARLRRGIARLYGWLTAASAVAGLVFWHWAFLVPLAVFFHLWTAMGPACAHSIENRCVSEE